MTPKQFLDTLPPERKEILSSLRDLILRHDKDVKEVVSDMMGNPSLIYVTKEDRLMKYSLSSAKNHMSFASMVMYGSSTRFGGSGLREIYEKLLPKAKFQKGCVNFKSAEQLPLEIAETFIIDMAEAVYPPPEYKDRMIANEKKRLEAVKKRGK